MNWIDGMAESTATEPLAVQRRRESRRQEWSEQTKLAGLLKRHLDPSCTFWTSLENKPISRISGVFQKRRGVRSGLPDVPVLYRGKPIFIELKSRRGVASKVQKQIRLEMLPAGASWWMARSARAALMALHLSGVVFRRKLEAAAAQAVGRDRLRTRHGGCREHPRWLHSDEPHGSGGGSVSASIMQISMPLPRVGGLA